MKQVGELNICGLVYGVCTALGEEHADLTPGEDGVCLSSEGMILIHARRSPSRKRDALVHEIAHAFLEGSGLRDFMGGRVRENYDEFEETLIRLLVPQFMRMLDDNAKELVRLVRVGKWSQ